RGVSALTDLWAGPRLMGADGLVSSMTLGTDDPGGTSRTGTFDVLRREGSGLGGQVDLRVQHRPRPSAELLLDPLEIRLDRARPDERLVGDFLVRLAARDERRDSPLG